MSGIFQGDIIIKTAIELGIEDMQKNPWLINHMLGDLTAINYLASKYGQKQIDACKEWFANNKIEISMAGRTDHSNFPLITIEMNPSPEKSDMKTMGDASTESVVLLPNDINKPIPYVIKPFTILGYDSGTGIIEVPASLDLTGVSAGMILVDPTTGQGVAIADITPDGIQVEEGLTLTNTTFGIVPQFQFYTARVEHTFQSDSYTIGCHCLGDPQVVMWLHSIVLYSIFRYRESLLEANGFAESSIVAGAPMQNPQFQSSAGQTGWTRLITLTGQVEQTWIKAPLRSIESVTLREKKSGGFTGGIKILSNTDTPPFIDVNNENWYAINENNDSE